MNSHRRLSTGIQWISSWTHRARYKQLYPSTEEAGLAMLSEGNVMLTKLLVFLLLALPVMLHATELEFEGTPEVKLQVMDGIAQTEAVAPQKAAEFRAVVVR